MSESRYDTDAPIEQNVIAKRDEELVVFHIGLDGSLISRQNFCSWCLSFVHEEATGR